ncbi:MAG: alanine--tRNA ligase, partial [bacterium]|nr:alanine--tRNA ligase [bacterium]MDW8163250.1 alanine--tRNA ligase [Candidatus Omnitrophota bacterium]
KFFENKGHKIVKSSSLIPLEDPTLLFTNAGMVQFKKFWSTDIPLPYKRAVSCQKCLRAGGKDSDLEKIGESGKHHTFFEMLGNFSFGDYFKKEAIEWAYEFVIEWLKIPEEKIWISYFRDDLETRDIWKRFLPENKLIPLGEKDNFWGPAGEIGPCGPCTEIYYDFGPDIGCGKVDCKPGCDCDRFLEFWNLVFPQYDKQKDGSFLTLKRRGVDTGMGLERITRILQGVETNYDTDLFIPIIRKIEEISGFSYKENKRTFRIISDHIRGIVFAISDGILPSNEGRGYVLRRIIRKGCLSGFDLNLKEPFLFNLAEVVIDLMNEIYPELKENKRIIEKVIHEEEERFHFLISSSRKIFFEVVKKEGEELLNGETLFKLYDTYGIPKDMIEELAFQYNKKVNWLDFEKYMEKQKEISRTKSKIGMKKEKILTSNEILETEFVGYNKTVEKAILTGIYKGEDNLFYFVFNRTPFYPEKGGQIGDKGFIFKNDFNFKVIDTQIDEKGLIYHIGEILKGKIDDLKIGDEFDLIVDEEFRRQVSINHTATHLLHYALREIIGKEVRQAGSYVGDDKLRFDFVCFSEINDEIIQRIENKVQEKIFEKVPVVVEEMSLNEAIEKGAIALFTEKYGEKVRVVFTGDFHKEVCGGTHLKNTGDIFLFHIISFSTIGKNLKRIEAITYKKCFEYYALSIDIVKKLSNLLKTDEGKIVERIEKNLQELREKERIIEKYIAINIEKITENILKNPEIIISNGREIKFFYDKVNIEGKNNMGKISDKVVEKVKNGVVFLISQIEGKSFFVFKIGDELTKQISATEVIKNLSKYIKGGGNERFVSGIIQENVDYNILKEEIKKKLVK